MTVQVPFIFESYPEDPGLVNWPSGTVLVTVYAKVSTPNIGQTYTIAPRLYRSQYEWDLRYPYDLGPATPQTLTTSWALYTWSIPVQALSGLSSDHFFFYIDCQSTDTNTGAFVHIGADGGSNNTSVATQFPLVPFVSTSLQRQPDVTRPTESENIVSSSWSFKSLPGDPNLVLWPASTWKICLWCKVDAGSANVTINLTRDLANGTPSTIFYTNLAMGTVTSTSYVLLTKYVSVPQSIGNATDIIEIDAHATIIGGTSCNIALGSANPSYINVPLLPINSTTGGGGSSGSGGVDTYKVLVESDATPGYLIDVVESLDHTIAFNVDPLNLKLNTVVNVPAPGKTFYLNPSAGSFHAQSLSLITPTSSTSLSATSVNGASVDLANADSVALQPGLLTWPAGFVKLKIWSYASSLPANSGYCVGAFVYRIKNDGSSFVGVGANFSTLLTNTSWASTDLVVRVNQSPALSTDVVSSTDQLYVKFQMFGSCPGNVGTVTSVIGLGGSNPTSLQTSFVGSEVVSTPPTVTLTNAGLAGISIVNYGTGPSLAVNSIESGNSYITASLDSPNNAVKINANVGQITNTLAAGDDSRFYHARYLDTDFTAVTINTNHPTASGMGLVSTSTSNATWQNILVPNAVSGTFTKVTVGNGLVTSGTTLINTDIPNISESQVINLTTDLGNKASSTDPRFPYLFSVAVPTVVGNAVEFCQILNTNFATDVQISLTVHSGSFAVSKHYSVPVQSAETGGNWNQVYPVGSTGAFDGQDLQVDVNIVTNTAIFRIRRTAGTIIGTAYLEVTVGGDPINTTVASSSNTYTGATVTGIFASTALSSEGSLVTTSGNLTVTGNITAGNITATPAATKIPLSDSSGTLNSWVTALSASALPPPYYAIGGNASIGNSGAAAQLFNVGTSGQFAINSSGIITSTVGLGSSLSTPLADLHLQSSGLFNFAISKNGQVGGFIIRDTYSGGHITDFDLNQFQAFNSSTISTSRGISMRWDERASQAPWSVWIRPSGTAYPGAGETLVLTLQESGAFATIGTLSGTNLTAAGHAIADVQANPTVANQIPIATAANAYGWSTITSSMVTTAIGSVVTAGTYTKVTVNASGLVTGTANISSSDVTTALTYTPLNPASGSSGTFAYPSSVTLVGGQVTSITAGSTPLFANAQTGTYGWPSSITLVGGQVTSITASGIVPLSGSGSANYLPKYSGANTLTTSNITDNGITVTIASNTTIQTSGIATSGSVDVNSGLFHVTAGGTVSGTMFTSTPSASKIPISDGSNTLNSWVTHASGDVPTSLTISGGSYLSVNGGSSAALTGNITLALSYSTTPSTGSLVATSTSANVNSWVDLAPIVMPMAINVGVVGTGSYVGYIYLNNPKYNKYQWFLGVVGSYTGSPGSVVLHDFTASADVTFGVTNITTTSRGAFYSVNIPTGTTTSTLQNGHIYSAYISPATDSFLTCDSITLFAFAPIS